MGQPNAVGGNIIPQAAMQSGGGLINPQQQSADFLEPGAPNSRKLLAQGGINAANMGGIGPNHNVSPTVQWLGICNK